MFDDQGIERGQTIAPALTQAIRESRISIVVPSKNYASSSWCLDELLEIFKCKEAMGQIVMTVFYEVDPSDVRKQTEEFGSIFKKTCARRKEEVKGKWSQALNDAGNIAGEHFLKWENESKMIEKIARDVSNKLHAKVSRDFEDMVGIEAHLEKLQSLLHLDYEDEGEDEPMIVGICGSVGIGKTTIARALCSRLSSNFQLTCFMGNIRESYNSRLDEYGSKLFLQEKLLSKISNQNGIRIYNLRVVPEKLCDQKVLIILDDVDDLKQFEALANEKNWLEHSLDPKIEGVLRVGYDNLHKDDQLLFLLIAFFFNYKDEDHMKAMLGDSNLDVRLGLKYLKSKSLIQISTEGEIVMHKLLQQVDKEENQRQDPGKRQILIDGDEICDVLENNSDSRRVMGISFDISTLQNDVYLSARALKKMRTLRFLKIYKTRSDTNNRVPVPEDMDFPSGLKLFDWTEYPEKCLPHTFKPENLVELNLSFNKLEKLWEGSQRRYAGMLATKKTTRYFYEHRETSSFRHNVRRIAWINYALVSS